MDTFERWFTQDLNKPILPQHGQGLVFTGDDGTPLVGVHVTRNGAPADLSGTVSCTVMRADGTTVPVTGGTISGGDVSVVLSSACFNIRGPIGVALAVTSGSTTMTVLKAVFQVDITSTDNIIDPSGEITLDVANLIADIDAAVASIPADYSDLLAAIAPTFIASKEYAAGEYVWNNGKLYRFTVAHAAGAWIGTDAAQVPLAGDVADLKSAITLIDTNHIRLESGTFTDATGTVKITNVNRARNIIPIPVENLNYIKMPDGYDMYIFLLNSAMSKIGTLYWSKLYTKNVFGDASYFNFAIRKTASSSTSIESEIDTIESGIEYVTNEKALANDNAYQNTAFRQFIGDKITPDQISEGYALHYDGISSALQGFSLLKYAVTPGDLVFISASVDNTEHLNWQGVWQWQNSSNVPSSGNTNLIGQTKVDGVNNFVVVPDGATWLIICAADANTVAGMYNVNIRANVDKNTNDIVVMQNGVFDGLTNKIPDAVANDWKLKSSGISAQDTDYRLIKYTVSAGETIYLKCTKDDNASGSAVWQFQNNASVPGSVNNYVVDGTKNDGYDGYITVPEEATYLIVSALKTNKVSGIYIPGINANTLSIVERYINNNTLTDRKSVQKNSDKNFVFFSDIHAGIVNFRRIVEFSNNLGGGTVDAIINGGDTVQSLLSESVDWYDTAMADADADVLTCVGNHDVWASFWSTGDPVTIYNKFTAPVVSNVSGIVQPENASTDGLNYYYKDYGNIRVIVLAAMYYTASDQMLWTPAQKTWLESVLADAKANTKSVVCVTHAPYMKSKAVIDENLPINSWRNYTNNSLFDGICVAQEAVDAVHAFVEGGGEFVCWLTGHTHQDMVMTESDYGDQFLVTIASAKYMYHSDGYSPAETELNATGFDCFDYIGIDTTNKMVKVWRIGYNEDASLRIRNRWAYDYANHKVISFS